jgi:hypothetical protein
VFLRTKIQKDFKAMITEMQTRMLLSKYTGKKPEEVEEELVEVLEHKDERFRVMGEYFSQERKEALFEELRKL